MSAKSKSVTQAMICLSCDKRGPLQTLRTVFQGHLLINYYYLPFKEKACLR